MKKPNIAVVNSSSFGKIFPEHWRSLQEFAELTRLAVPIDINPNHFAEQLRPYHGIVASVNPDYTKDVLSQLSNLCVITRHGIGYNNINIAAATAMGVVVTKVEGQVEQNAVAEHAVALLLSAARCIPQGDLAVRNNLWKDRAAYVGIELCNKNIAIIGLGNIGSKTAQILRAGFNANIIGVDPNLNEEQMLELQVTPMDLKSALKTADCIMLHSALTTENKYLLNKETLQLVKPDVIIVNTARGELVDSAAIAEALQDGKIRAYASDVVEGEPIDNNHRLLKAPNCIIVPHLGGYTYESLHGMGETMVKNMQEILINKRVPENAINIDSIAKVKTWA